MSDIVNNILLLNKIKMHYLDRQTQTVYPCFEVCVKVRE